MSDCCKEKEKKATHKKRESTTKSMYSFVLLGVVVVLLLLSSVQAAQIITMKESVEEYKEIVRTQTSTGVASQPTSQPAARTPTMVGGC